ncbi:glycoside hydrolase family 99-like domain-containing protein [Homoserinibacter sp. GY 40078]|uniref:glycosyltransferase WbsX family protein n=1 Tax=Homoserinibacter sp. GY 40078 TaxID=2603275 RepID=UPI0011C76486|nr:glycoside hydrolase family 99-like domain-containing protein [Homoserinibacter sp. GY 40078]TXK16375.1 hypothetical protein FVQ89_14090 [Homoserinibacter sp. GY 40078]
MTSRSTRYQTAVYYFPGYHHDPRYRDWHGDGWTEWELVRRAEPRFPGHEQPRVPAWGYGDESDPQVAGRSIRAAADHGITAFIYDWYWYGDAPFLEGALERGYLASPDRERLKFALMWANHDWVNIHPVKRGTNPTVLEEGAVSPEVFVHATDYMIETYLGRPEYWRPDGRPYVSFYDLPTLIAGLGGVDATADALADFRERARRAIGTDLHLNAVLVGSGILVTDRALPDPGELVERLGFDSTTAYVSLHHAPLRGTPATDYSAHLDDARSRMRELAATVPVPFFPNVTVGWDASPRTVQSDVYEDLDRYPFTGILTGATPEAFAAQLAEARAWADDVENGHGIITVNAWNEWTEGSYLEPDTHHGMAYLEAIRRELA